ncbi:hypothetical protein AVEN_213492-1 [Araneus ventricosus]|uniref:Uncharacterized protein n=1 Tax=Araneus ventricosus TaxID=182803 RepID=A0A4Y2PXA9_ARAVE|nr:hypothetical protein AVEN_213492-1 [Araneus ventricosus]
MEVWRGSTSSSSSDHGSKTVLYVFPKIHIRRNSNFEPFGKHPDNCCACGEPGAPLHYATKCRLTLSYHLWCPADQHIEAWMKSTAKHRLLSNKIIDLLNFITIQEDLLKSEQPE